MASSVQRLGLHTRWASTEAGEEGLQTWGIQRLVLQHQDTPQGGRTVGRLPATVPMALAQTLDFIASRGDKASTLASSPFQFNKSPKPSPHRPSGSLPKPSVWGGLIGLSQWSPR